MADDDTQAERPDPTEQEPSYDGEQLLHPWADQPEAKNIRLPLRVPTLAELERMLVILAMVDHMENEETHPPVLN